jgi:hypothetical protein
MIRYSNAQIAPKSAFAAYALCKFYKSEFDFDGLPNVQPQPRHLGNPAKLHVVLDPGDLRAQRTNSRAALR